MDEWLMIACMGSGAILFPIGGTGFKWARRFLLPIVLGGLAMCSGFVWYLCLGYAIGQSVTLCLPYGERTPYALKAAVFVSYAMPSLFLGFTYWQIISPIIFFGCFCLSNWKPTASTFVWKIVEATMGFFLGVTIAALISKGTT